MRMKLIAYALSKINLTHDELLTVLACYDCLTRYWSGE